MAFQFTNNAVTTLASGISNSATSLTVASGKGALFPSPGAGFRCTLVRASDGAIEIVQVTARTTDTFTITRAQEGTTALTLVTGDAVELRITAAVLANIPQLDSTDTLSNKTLTTPGINGYTEGVVTANTSTAYTINIASASMQILTLTGNCTYTFPTAAPGKSFLLVQRQDATGSRTVTWPAAVKWPGGTAPTLTATASKADLFAFTCDGTNWFGRAMGSNYA